MFNLRRLVGVVGILLVATIGSASAQTATSPVIPSQASTQTGNPSAGTRVKAWTRSKLDAAKKQWAQNEAKFTDCQKQLGDKQKVKRLSLHNQGHFLEKCMSRNS